MRWPLPWPKSWRKEPRPEPETPGGPEDEEKPKSVRESGILFARDLAVAFLIVAIVIGSLFAYTGVWPPMVVVESNSMQHADGTGFVGVIDTGDLVLVQGVRQPSDVVTYVQGRDVARVQETYSAFGDVIIFHRPGSLPSSTPIIHRALVYVRPNPSGGADVPSLVGQPDWRGENRTGTPTTTNPFGLRSLTIERVRSWQSGAGPDGTIVEVSFNLSSIETDGFLTKGDHNTSPDTWGPVSVSRVLGRARGELPWFGLLKLSSHRWIGPVVGMAIGALVAWVLLGSERKRWLAAALAIGAVVGFAVGSQLVFPPPTSGCCVSGWGDPAAPANSWNALLLSLILIIAGPFAADFGWTYYRDRRKRKKEAEAGAAKEASPNPGNGGPEADSAPGPSTASEPPPREAPEVTDGGQTESAGPGAGGP